MLSWRANQAELIKNIRGGVGWACACSTGGWDLGISIDLDDGIVSLRSSAHKSCDFWFYISQCMLSAWEPILLRSSAHKSCNFWFYRGQCMLSAWELILLQYIMRQWVLAQVVSSLSNVQEVLSLIFGRDSTWIILQKTVCVSLTCK